MAGNDERLVLSDRMVVWALEGSDTINPTGVYRLALALRTAYDDIKALRAEIAALKSKDTN